MKESPRIAVLTLLLSAAGALPLFAADGAAAGAAAQPVVWIDACPGLELPEAGIWMSLDTDTGTLKRTLRERAAMRIRDPYGNPDPLDRSSDGLTLVIGADGTKSVNLEGRFETSLLARTDANGDSEEFCAENADQARTFLSNPPASKKTGREVK